MKRIMSFVFAAMMAGIAFCADEKELNGEGGALMKDKAWQAAAEKFIEAANAKPTEPRRLDGRFNDAVKNLGKSQNTNEVATAISLAEKALLIPGLSAASRIKVQHVRIRVLANAGRQQEAFAIAQDLLDSRIATVDTALAAAEANVVGKVGREDWFNYLERLLNNPVRYGLEGKELKRLIDNYSGDNGNWGGNIINRPRLEKAEQYYEKYGFGKITPNRLAEMREMDEHFPRPESELNIPNDLSSFGIDPNRKIVHAKDFGWNPTNVTECLTKALNSDASTVIIDDMGSPWYTRTVKLGEKTGSNKQIVFKKGVKVHAVTQPNFVKGSMFELDKATNVVFIGEGELGKDVYIGQFPNRAARFASGVSYGGSCFSGRGNNVLVKNLWIANNLDDGFCMCGSYHYIVDCILDDNFRQGLSVVWSDHGVYKNVTFCHTVGGEPHNGFDLEPVYESYSCPWHYFLNCKFFDNAAGNVVLSSSTYAPNAVYFKDCEFEAGRYRNFTTIARLGVYLGQGVEAPSKIILENCRLDGYADAPVLFWNTMIFNMTFKKCVFNDKGHLDPTRKPNMSPILLGLDRGYWDGFYPKAGKVNFEDCTFNGWEGKPLIAVADHNGKLGINTFSGVVNHNGKQVDLSKFSYLPPERKLKDAEDPDLKSLDVASPADSCVPGFDFNHDAQWYHPNPVYGYLFKGEKGKKATISFTGTGTDERWTMRLRTPSGTESELGQIKIGENDFVIDFAETGVYMIYGVYFNNYSIKPSGYRFSGAKGTSVAYVGMLADTVGRRLQITVPVDKPRAVGYFEVTAGKQVNIKLSSGGLEILDETGKSLIRLEEGEYFGTKTFALNPKADAIWSFRALTPSVKFRFFASYAGIIAETPEALPVKKPNLAFTKIDAVPAPELKDEPPLPLPEKYAEEVAKLVADRLALAKQGLEAKRLAEAEASLAKLKQHANDDGTKREIDDVTHTVERLTHSAKAEELALHETPEDANMAVMCAKYATAVAPEMMWMVSLKDGFFTYPDQRALRTLYNEIIRRLESDTEN